MAIIKSEEEPLVLGYNPSSILFRVHDELSATQLCDDHGFTATHPDFQSESSGMPISGRVWQKTYQRDYYSSESRDATVESIITHVLGGWPGYAGAYTDDSNWISTTRSLEWAVWEIVRRLVVLGRPYVELSLIDYEGYSKYYKGSRMISEDVAEAIEEYRCDYGLTRSQKMALRFAEASSEVVCFGRIFEKDILAIRLWTERVSVFPSYVFTEIR